MTTDTEFIKEHENEIIQFRLGQSTRRGMKVGQYFIIFGTENGYMLYQLHQRKPVIDRPFESIQDAYSLAQSIIRHYKTYLPMLADGMYAENFFDWTKHSVPAAHKLMSALEYLNEMPIITNVDMMVAFDKPIT